MDVIETPSPLAASEAALCQPLSDEAGWNQVQADWRLMLEHGQGFAIRNADGVPKASAVALPMGARVGWISMVLVTETHRRRGYAKRLMGACIDWLEQSGRVPFLDATPAGQPLYASLGFGPVQELSRMAGRGGHPAAMTGLRPATPADAAWVSALDRAVFEGERPFVIESLLNRDGAVGLVREARDGFALSRAGRNATQVGPVIAPDPEQARRLVDSMLALTPGPVFADVIAQGPLERALAARGFTRQRPFLRMAKGLSQRLEDSAWLHAMAGPELG